MKKFCFLLILCLLSTTISYSMEAWSLDDQEDTSKHSEISNIDNNSRKKKIAEEQRLKETNVYPEPQNPLDETVNDKGQTVLMLAAIYGNTEAAKLIIAKGVDLNKKDTNGNTALILAY